MLHAIPNPKKNLSVDFSLDKVKTGVERISRLSNNKYKFTKSNAVFNQYTYEASEFLSLGVFIDINLSSINENKTDITIEIRRKIGTFNQPSEVTLANQHFDKIIDLISKGITMSESDYNLLVSKEVEEENKKLKNAADKKARYEQAKLESKIKSEEEKKNNPVKYYVKNISILMIFLLGFVSFGLIINKIFQDKKSKTEIIEKQITDSNLKSLITKENNYINKNIELLKSGKICKGSINPKLHQWVYNNRTNEALMIVSPNEWSSDSKTCVFDAVNQHLGDIYTRYATKNEVDKSIKSIESLLK